jgi:hypothetical protein
LPTKLTRNQTRKIALKEQEQMEILQLNFSVRKKKKHKTGGNTETLLLAYKDMQMLAKTSMR